MARLSVPNQGSSSGSTTVGAAGGPDAPRPGAASQDKVERIINLIRPAVQADGGDVEFVSISPDGVVSIRLHGACIGCPSASVTLQLGIERNLKEHVPEVKAVVAVD